MIILSHSMTNNMSVASKLFFFLKKYLRLICVNLSTLQINAVPFIILNMFLASYISRKT